MEDNNFYIRINYKAQGNNINSNYKAHIVNSKNSCEGKYLIGAGIYNKNGGTILFKAKNLDEAMEVANKNMFNKDSYTNKYEETKRDLVILPNNLIL